MLIAILGAGGASRFGGDKLTVDCAGKPLGQWAMEAALGLGYPVLWIGRGDRPDFLASRCTFYSNANSSEGLSSSLAIGARAAKSDGASSLLVMLADMPLMTLPILEALVRAGPLAACDYGNRPGVPALFPADMFQDIIALRGDTGAGPLLRGTRDVELVRADPESLLDVDTPEDLLRAERALAGPAPPGWLDPYRRRRF